jgi:hypothetical protein
MNLQITAVIGSGARVRTRKKPVAVHENLSPENTGQIQKTVVMDKCRDSPAGGPQEPPISGPPGIVTQFASFNFPNNLISGIVSSNLAAAVDGSCRMGGALAIPIGGG